MFRSNYEDQTIEGVDLDHYDLCQIKQDGHWACLDIAERWAEVRTRKGKVKHRIQLSERHRRSVFIGEWMRGTQRSGASPLGFVVFDCSTANHWNVEARPYLQRMIEAKRVDIPKEITDVLGPVGFAETHSAAKALDFWPEVESGKHEGLILRANRLPFGATCARVKPRAEVDYYATQVHHNDQGQAISIGGAKYRGGPEVVRARLMRVGGDFASLAASWGGFKLGRCFVATGQELTDRGSLRFPFFQGWHNEK